MKRAVFILFALAVTPMLTARASPEPKMIRPTVKVEGVQGSRTPIFVSISWRAKNPDGGSDWTGFEENTINGNGSLKFYDIPADAYTFTAKAQLNELCRHNCRVSQKFDHVPTGVILLKF